MVQIDMPGTGDPATWGAVVDPRDPRWPDGDERSLVLKLGDAEVEVFYSATSDNYAHISAVAIGDADVDLRSFSNWQLESWAASIRRHLLSEAEDAHYDRLAEQLEAA